MSDGRMLFERERKDMANIVRLIFTRKLTNVAGGNFSFLAKKEGKQYIIMTPTMMSEAYLGDLSAAQVLVVDLETREVVSGVGNLTREINMHQACYQANPKIKAVLHAHAPNAMFWATSGLPMPNLTEATQKVGPVPVMSFAPNCSEELADITSSYIKENNLPVPHMLLLDSHGVLINATGDTGMTAIHKALAILDTVEWNAEIAYKQTIFQALGIMDNYHSKGDDIADLDDLKANQAIYNKAEIAAGGD
ncbi:L-fuculose-phosphate aldolase [Enterococcus sp. PF1-24]|uniref:class II aldolase/adducin family protein n=1 Tax=unclassified Enterococcus TaxID=2608891 RepID=UPI002475CC5E|nr:MULTISPECIES: class II aldolase/adducin family protein [unclassified Enterococcus]MDH6364840.1 L-fuculose-phosphate aldolase [Enterococcus sp. PFB1-1]MDH6401936.1 L-fuculose-phosphate aldolase [Enterococcus sp. PF1-24]